MSHLTTVKTKITNLEALKDAVSELGAEWREGQTTYKWYGHSVGEYPLPEGMSKESLGTCAHAIRVPGVEYEIGVYRKTDGTYGLAFDFWGSGKGLQAKFGQKLEKLTQKYATNNATMEFRKRGYSVTPTTAEDGRVRLTVTRGW
jgi:hypothetical protein